MKGKSGAIRKMRLNRMNERILELQKKQTDAFRKHCDRVICVTRFLCAQYTRRYGTHAIPVQDLPLIYSGTLMRDIEMLAEAAGQTGEMLLESLAEEFRLTAEERETLHCITLDPERSPERRVRRYAEIVRLAECYDKLLYPEEGRGCSHAEAIVRLHAGACGTFDVALMACMEELYRELQALEQCSANHDRIVLLSSIYRGDRRYYWLRKRLFDVVASSLGLLVLSPVLLLICLMIVIDDPKGGPFFKQTRVGRHKRLFKMYKFRTMYTDAEARKAELEKLNEKDGPVFKIANDPRITRVGKFLRKTSLDELPQLLNVIKGEMTLVGPRPPLPKEVENYTRYDEMRLSVTPGLTCVWQVQPQRDSIRFDQWVDMDLAYIGTRSQILDIKLLFRTVLAVLGKSGS